MAPVPVSEVLVGVYLGLIAALFPSFIAFAIGFVFKYFTNVTVPGLGVVALGGALAGVTGGLMGLLDPQLASGWTGITAVLVILMGCLWAHSQGDKLAAATPRGLTLKSLRENRLSAEFTERIDSYGQIRVRPLGEIRDIDGYPPLPESLREQLQAGVWRFPADLAIPELQRRLEDRLVTDYELAEVSVTIDARGRAEIAAAPSGAGLSRRVPDGQRAVSVRTLLPTGVGRGDVVTVQLPDGDVTGPVVSARTDGTETPPEPEPKSELELESVSTTSGENPVESERARSPRARTTGGEGRVTLTVKPEAAKRVIETTFARTIVHPRGRQRVYAAIDLLRGRDNRFRTVTVGEDSPLAGTTVATARAQAGRGVAILAIRRVTEQLIAPPEATELVAGDRLIVVGGPGQLAAFTEVAE